MDHAADEGDADGVTAPFRCALAEYLRLRPHFEEQDAALIAEFLSLAPVESHPGEETRGHNTLADGAAPGVAQPKLTIRQVIAGGHDYPARIPPLPFPRHLGHRRYGRPTAIQHSTTTRPRPSVTLIRQPLDVQPLQPWSALWPLLKQELSLANPGRDIDLPGLIDRVCEGEPLKEIPVCRDNHWPQRIIVIIDCSPHLLPVQEDFLGIVGNLRRWFPDRVELLVLEDAEQGEFLHVSRAGVRRHSTRPSLPAHAVVLVLSDLGLFRKAPWARLGSTEWGRTLQETGHQPLALVPAHPGDWQVSVTRDFRCACLDRGHLMRHQSPLPGRDRGAEQEQLLTLLAPMARITPALLREARMEHPAGLSISAEIEFWSRSDFGTSLAFREWRDGELQRNYMQRLAESPDLVRLAERLMRTHENSLPMRLRILQKQTFSAIESLDLGTDQEGYLAQLQESMDSLQGEERRFLDNWLARLEECKGEAAWLSGVEPLYRRYYARLSSREQEGKTPPDQGKGREWWLQVRDAAEVVLVEPVAESAVLATPSADAGMEQGDTLPGHLATVAATGPLVVRVYDGARRVAQHTLHPGQSFRFDKPLTRLTIDTGSQVETFDWPTCPSWASGIGRDRHGLFVEVEVEGIGFVLRWIPPGEFMMGSPKDEPQRLGSEDPQHRVRFAKGFWLAETACTQALWRAVIGDNPSRFGHEGSEHPVENVSWNDVQRFIEKVNGQYPGLDLRLPSEAEWEYACRAGTSTPFWFGSELTPDRANYDGNLPYADGPKGKYREKTVPVKMFLPNPWGLYQMHGNVFEWCEDRWHDSYAGAPEAGEAWMDGGSEFRVLRGGSWDDFGRGLRSASRLRARRGDADILGVSGGFRLVRGPELQSGRSGAAGAASGQPARGTSGAGPRRRRRGADDAV